MVDSSLPLQPPSSTRNSLVSDNSWTRYERMRPKELTGTNRQRGERGQERGRHLEIYSRRAQQELRSSWIEHLRPDRPSAPNGERRVKEGRGTEVTC
eukprot:219453-Hanusia_phi.AAC.1